MEIFIKQISSGSNSFFVMNGNNLILTANRIVKDSSWENPKNPFMIELCSPKNGDVLCTYHCAECPTLSMIEEKVIDWLNS